MRRAGLGLVVLLCFSPVASAFEPSVTCGGGLVGHWDPSTTDWYLVKIGTDPVYTQLPDAQVQSAIEAGWVVWSNPMSCCTTWESNYQGFTEETFDDSPGLNVIEFEEDTWDGAFGDPSSTIAITLNAWNGGTCEFVSADQLYNAANFTFGACTMNCFAVTDLQSIAAHENGHWLGLGHSLVMDGGPLRPTMSEFYSNEDEERSLAVDDEEGVCFLYPGFDCPGFEWTCTDMADEDSDGDIDCADSDCATDQACTGVETDCNDGTDNDLDSDVDCSDTDCAAAPECTTELTCDDGVDNDNDGDLDCNDSDCATFSPCFGMADCTVCQPCTGNSDCGSDGLCADFGPPIGMVCVYSCAGGTECPGDSTCFDFSGTPVCVNPNFPMDFDLCPGSYTCADHAPTCQATEVLGCNATVAGNNSGGPTDVATWDCVALATNGREVVYSLTPQADGMVTIDMTGLTTDLDLVVTTPKFDGGCDPGNCITGSQNAGTADENVSFMATAFQTYFVVVDAPDLASGPFTLVTTCPTTPTEVICDDGGDEDGDGFVDCMDSDCAGDTSCSTEVSCINGFDDDGDGSVDCNDSDCAADPDCQPFCMPMNTLPCNGAVVGSNIMGLSEVDAWPCAMFVTNGREAVFTITPIADGMVTVDMVNLNNDLDLFVSQQAPVGGCNPNACLDASQNNGLANEQVSWMATAFTTYVVVADGFGAATSSFTLLSDCPVPPNEVDCDDGQDEDQDNATDCEDTDCSGSLPDTDSDGVGDICDACPGADDGMDADSDGAPDACDACPLDANGDSDSDGSCDSADLCTGDDASGDADSDGACDDTDACPMDDPDDSDSDGVCESADACAGFDDNADMDSDGTADGCDACPLDANGDSDSDGSCDSDDLCTGDDGTGDADSDGACGDLDQCAGNDASGDTDSDGVCDDQDQCVGDDTAGDSDSDGVCDDQDQCAGDDATGDTDSDGVCDDQDQCAGDDTAGDTDSDGVCDDQDQCAGDDATGDTDSDGDCDDTDPCPADAPNDTDSDGVCDSDDACPGFDDGLDADSDGQADGCDPCPADAGDDSDSDGSCDGVDLCVGDDGTGDTDSDGTCDDVDPCPADAPNDSDSDGVCDSSDACPGFDDALDMDSDGVANGCDPCPADAPNDSDSDGVCDSDDACPGSDDTLDADSDGVADGCDPCPLDAPDDSDSDGVCESADACPGFDDALDADSDGVADGCDNCPDDANPGQEDMDSDGTGDECDCPGGGPPPGTADSLRFLERGEMTWLDVPEASEYVVYRGSIPSVGGMATRPMSPHDHQCIIRVAAPSFTDTDEPVDDAFYYLVASENACGATLDGLGNDSQRTPRPVPDCP